MLQTWSRNSIGYMQDLSLRLILDISPMMIILCIGKFASCMLSNPCRYLDESNSMRLQLTHILSNLYNMVVEVKGSTNPCNISFDKIFISNFIWYQIHDCQFGYTSALPCKTNPCR